METYFAGSMKGSMDGESSSLSPSLCRYLIGCTLAYLDRNLPGRGHNASAFPILSFMTFFLYRQASTLQVENFGTYEEREDSQMTRGSICVRMETQSKDRAPCAGAYPGNLAEHSPSDRVGMLFSAMTLPPPGGVSNA